MLEFILNCRLLIFRQTIFLIHFLPKNEVILDQHVPHLKLIHVVILRLQIVVRLVLRALEIEQLINLSLHSVGDSLRQPFSENGVQDLFILELLKSASIQYCSFIDQVRVQPTQDASCLADQLSGTRVLAHNRLAWARGGCLLLVMLSLNKHLLNHLRVRHLNIVRPWVEKLIDHMPIHIFVLWAHQRHCDVHETQEMVGFCVLFVLYHKGRFKVSQTLLLKLLHQFVVRLFFAIFDYRLNRLVHRTLLPTLVVVPNELECMLNLTHFL